MVTRSSRTSALRRLLTGLGAVAVAAGAALVATPAHAYEQAFFHTQSVGNQGVDVLAIHHLLDHHGHPAGADGVFTAETDEAVRAFQTEAGIGVDGIVGPVTWARLVPDLAEGDSGPAVRALQVELNAKSRLDLAVDGTFSPAVAGAVTDFQEHAGIDVTGAVDETTWRNLVWHYAYPDFGVGMCDQDPDNNGTANWGTGGTVGQLEAAITAYDTAAHGEVPLGDIGFEHGGDIPGHASHQDGMDVDLWPARTDTEQCTAGRITWRSPEYDRDATRALARAIHDAAPGHVKLIFFNDPVLIDEGLTEEYPNHDNHLHVRYCELVHADDRYTC